MRNPLLFAVLAVLTCSAAFGDGGDVLYSGPGQGIDVGHRKLNFYCTGSGAPTVILEAGLGSRPSSWSKVQPLIAANHHRVCSYDRAGYGFSDSDSRPRTAARIASDLKRALGDASFRGPFVLVAATYGAFPVRLLAGLMPSQIAGLVLLNPSPEDEELTPASPTVERIDTEGLDHAKFCLAAARQGALSTDTPQTKQCIGDPNPNLSDALNAARRSFLSKPGSWATVVSEWSTIRQSAAEVKAKRGKKFHIPLTVISARDEQAFEGSDEDEKALHEAWLNWSEWQHDIAALSDDSRLLRTPGGGRNVELSDPSMVAAAVEDVIARAAR